MCFKKVGKIIWENHNSGAIPFCSGVVGSFPQCVYCRQVRSIIRMEEVVVVALKSANSYAEWYVLKMLSEKQMGAVSLHKHELANSWCSVTSSHKMCWGLNGSQPWI